jgi:2-oxoglutarate ferredoxin oxidoreductase subunit alpha
MKSFEKGNIAIGKAAIAAGCSFYVGYPITPQNDVPEFMSEALPPLGRTFIQGSSEVECGEILLGAALGGARAMTSTSGPGMSLFAEGISFMTGMDCPAVIVDVARPGPGMGGIDAAQQDYLYCVKAPGNGGGRAFVMSPSSVQELVDMVYSSFDIAEKYTNPVIILTDAIIGQTWEVVEIPEERPLDSLPCNHKWDQTWRESSDPKDQKWIGSLYMPVSTQEDYCNLLRDRYIEMRQDTKWETYRLDDAEIVVFAYGSVARIAKTAIDNLREAGIKAGLFRPITLFPFPTQQIRDLDYGRIKKAIDIEMSPYGMMQEDVEIAVKGQVDVEFFGRSGGILITADQIFDQVKALSERS